MTVSHDNRFKKGNISLSRFYLPLLAIMLVGYCLTCLPGGTDFWAHAAVGRWIVQHHQIPNHTLFLWSDNIPWIWHSWLSQVIFYELLAHVSESTGSLLAMLLTGVVVAGSMLWWWKVWMQNQQKLNGSSTPGFWMPLIFMLAIYAAHARFFPRPEIFSALLLTVLLWMVIRGISSWRSLALLFLLFVLWTNLHAGMALGLLILGITTICNWAQDKSWCNTRWELAACIVAIAAVFVNPYGWHYWSALHSVSSITFSFIDEWKPFWRQPLLDAPTVASAFLCFVCALSAWWWSAKRRWAHLMWLLAIMAMFLVARRNVWSLAQITLVVIACNPKLFLTSTSWNFCQRLARRKIQIPMIPLALQRISRIGIFICLILAAVKAQSPEFWEGHWVNKHVPNRALLFLRKIGPHERIFNGYEVSSYLEWKLGGKPPLFIDLLNAYHPGIMQDYIGIIDATPQAQSLLDQWHFDVIVLANPEPGDSPSRLMGWLYAQSRWRIVYYGSDCIIWRKTSKIQP